MFNPCYFTDENLKTGFKFNLKSLSNNHANSLLSIIPVHTDFEIETRYFNKILEELATIYARLINQKKFNYHIINSASFYKINEEDQKIDEVEFIIDLNVDYNLTESDINNIDVKSQLEHQIKIQETKDSGWIFDKINSMKIRFYRTGDVNGSSHVKVALRTNAILNIEHYDKYCFLWSILASLHPCKEDHPKSLKL